ncbi:MAG TPA: DUF305 domain-containing protein [Candidatus Limnocylindrales bacterium]
MANPERRRSIVILTAFLLAALGLSASGATPAVAPATATGTRVIVPGRPGETARVDTSGQVKPPEANVVSAVDAWFVRMMIPHHAQALEMAAFASTRARNPQIAAIAARIKAAQTPEIMQFKAWLDANKLSETEPGGHDHDAMPGMQSREAMRALAAATGDEFDRMFVQMMSEHHRGAMDMAELRLRSNGDVMIERLAEAIAFEQAVEINRLHDIIAAP